MKYLTLTTVAVALMGCEKVLADEFLNSLEPEVADRLERLRTRYPTFSVANVQDKFNALTTYLGVTERTESESPLYITKLQNDDEVVQVIIDSTIQTSRTATAAFVDAADFWNNVIGQTNLARVRANNAAGICGLSQNDFNGVPQVFESILIFAQAQNIDGVGRVLGQAGPCATFQGFPRVGSMVFDIADINNLLNDGSFDEVIKHEMGHVIGIGTLWSGRNLVRNPCNGANPCNTNPTYRGRTGIRGFELIGGNGVPAVADQGGAGTADGHWRERTFQNELMTGFLSPGENPLSLMTVGSLADLGYSINANAAENFQIPGQNSNLQADSIELGTDAGYAGGVDESETNILAEGSGSSSDFTVAFIAMGAVAAILAIVGLVAVQKKKSRAKEIERSKRWMNGGALQPQA